MGSACRNGASGRLISSEPSLSGERGRLPLPAPRASPPLAAARSAGPSRFRLPGTWGEQSMPRREHRMQFAPASKMHFTLARRQLVQAVLTGGWSLSQSI